MQTIPRIIDDSRPYWTDLATGQRSPNLHHSDPSVSGDGVRPLTWAQQWRLLETVRRNKDFRDELLVALGLETTRRRRP